MRLPAVLGIEQAGALKAMLGETLDAPGRVVLDGAEVDAIHGAALQLFCLYCRDRSAMGHEVEFARPSPALRSAAALLGASTLLRIAGAAS
ncbi:MAG: STAS domain-containing protein [Nevskia sp.]|nr:STAS domain-containing protein [Nevskia sp.]